ncbi:MAG: polymer-forming cytoskeletal protein [Candidatus Margulisiibacteriota bacterium]
MKRNGNLGLTLLIMLGLSFLLGAFLIVVIGRTTDSSQKKAREKSFYIAEAGVKKAVWSLMTPSGLGGKGTSWRPANFSESFGGGSYSFSILEGISGTLTIISTGEANGYTRTILQKMNSSSLPAAFNYAIYNNGSLDLKGSSCVIGGIFANGNVSVQKTDNHPSGETFTAPGYTVNGIPGTVPDPVPTMPSLNSTYYDEQIALAQIAPAGNQILNNMDLGGGTVYVKGDATISGNITGGGVIVVTGSTTINGAIISENTKIIGNGLITVKSTTNVASGGVLYSPTQIDIPGNPRIFGSVMSAKITANGTPTIMGLLFSWDVSTEMNGNVTVYGSVVNPSSSTYSGNINLEYDPEYIPDFIEGLSAGGVGLVKGSWKEL